MTNIATPISKASIAYNRSREVPCPRCMEQCGWCSDPRWMHGTLNLPGAGRKCAVPGYEPEGSDCPVCRGRQRVMMRRTFHPVEPGGSGREENQNSDAKSSSENQPNFSDIADDGPTAA